MSELDMKMADLEHALAQGCGVSGCVCPAGRRFNLFQQMKRQKEARFSDANTWRNSGPPWSETADREANGWDEAVLTIFKLLLLDEK